jgi:hypothetical protein
MPNRVTVTAATVMTTSLLQIIRRSSKDIQPFTAFPLLFGYLVAGSLGRKTLPLTNATSKASLPPSLGSSFPQSRFRSSSPFETSTDSHFIIPCIAGFLWLFLGCSLYLFYLALHESGTKRAPARRVTLVSVSKKKKV